ncbi:MAG: ABC transporter permease, partial [Pyrinomonadaceae bacterium]
DYAAGAHFESRLAHVHGNLFAFLNIVVGYLLVRLPLGKLSAQWISWLTLAGMLMPLGILAEMTMTITIGYVILSVTVSSSIGVIAGLYPAWKAAKLDPIVALTQS